ncbi:MAG: hypothetical protein Q7R83_03835 [bacterium]|nr:hypothetical protein [bacterium]
MKTLIFDIDGTLTDLWPLERAILLMIIKKNLRQALDDARCLYGCDTYRLYRMGKKKPCLKIKYYELYDRAVRVIARRGHPSLAAYPLVAWIKKNRTRYHFVYATGGGRGETLLVLRILGLSDIFDLSSSVDRNNCRFRKKTGMPYARIKRRFPDCVAVTDSKADVQGAQRAKIPFHLVSSRTKFLCV